MGPVVLSIICVFMLCFIVFGIIYNAFESKQFELVIKLEGSKGNKSLILNSRGYCKHEKARFRIIYKGKEVLLKKFDINEKISRLYVSDLCVYEDKKNYILLLTYGNAVSIKRIR